VLALGLAQADQAHVGARFEPRPDLQSCGAGLAVDEYPRRHRLRVLSAASLSRVALLCSAERLPRKQPHAVPLGEALRRLRSCGQQLSDSRLAKSLKILGSAGSPTPPSGFRLP